MNDILTIGEPVRAWVRMSEVVAAIIEGQSVSIIVRGINNPFILGYPDIEIANDAFSKIMQNMMQYITSGGGGAS